jgi:hypothetical protein
LYVADPKGAQKNYDAIKFADKLGIPAVTFTAEGHYKPEYIERMFWGHISDKKLIERINVQWSTRDRDLILEIEPDLAKQLKVGGAVGFDRYKIYPLFSKEVWRKRYQFSHQRMIGYASWGFDAFHRQDKWTSNRKEIFGDKTYERFREERLEVNKILVQLVEQNPDIMFLIKEHPGVIEPQFTEIINLKEYPNVLYINNEESISDCISGCDIWMAFESTTVVEAWLLKKPTILINPFGGGFPRSDAFEGCLTYQSFEDIQNAVDEFYELGSLKLFDQKEQFRHWIIEETMQWDDGKNHMRVALLFKEVLNSCELSNLTVGIKDWIMAFTQNLLFQYSHYLKRIPRFHTYSQRSAQFSKVELEDRAHRFGQTLEAFHRNSSLSERDIWELNKINSEIQ